MATHECSVGDQVRLFASKHSGDVPVGVYTISRKLPVKANGCQYRVEHALDGHERVARDGRPIGPGGDQA